jgi:hypothetical protein
MGKSRHHDLSEEKLRDDETVLATPASNNSPSEAETSDSEAVVKEEKKPEEEPPTFAEIISDGISHHSADYIIPAEQEADLDKYAEQLARIRSPRNILRLPSKAEGITEARGLLSSARRAFAFCACLPDRSSSLLTFWALSTWFQNPSLVAPCLILTGSPHEGEAVLRLLSALTYHPLLMTGLTLSNLKDVAWQLNPTLLVKEPNWNRRTAWLVGGSTAPGYVVPTSGERFLDFFGPKAIYVGEDWAPVTLPAYAIHVTAGASVKNGHPGGSLLPERIVRAYQNALLNYRLEHLFAVLKSDFKVTRLSPEANTIATVLGRCVVDAPDLQDEIVSLLAPQARRQRAELEDSLQGLVVRALVSVCRAGRDRVFVSEISEEVNRTLETEGENVRYSAEKVGHKLKRMGFFSRRLSQAGNGLLLDRPTCMLIEELGTGLGMEDSPETNPETSIVQHEENKVAM